MMGKNFSGRLMFFVLTMVTTLIAPDFWGSATSYVTVLVFTTFVFWEELRMLTKTISSSFRRSK